MSRAQTLARVPLDSNALYIYTIPLIGESFHWGLLYIDAHGVTSRHHWAATSADLYGPEGYVFNVLPNGAMTMTGNNIILAYFKLQEIQTLPNIEEFKKICAAIFPTSRRTAQENRAVDITCRTWIIHILDRLLSTQRAQAIEAFVKTHSIKCGNIRATDFLFSRPYQTQIIPVV